MKELIKKLQIEKYVVDDILKQDIEYIFILESPHIDEIKNGIPVVGKSGKDMSMVLFGEDRPFGLLIKEDSSKKIGIMNISNIPLQSSAYACDVMNGQSCTIFRMLEQIRNNPNNRKRKHKNYEQDKINNLIQKIFDDFKGRIEKIDEYQNKKYILCGEFAQKVVENIEMKLLNKFEVIHPSRTNWTKIDNQNEIKKLKKFLNLS